MAKKGHKWSQEQKDRIKGENHHRWKGDDVGMNPLHLWIKRRLEKPKLCEKCKKVPPYDLANKSGEYKRDLDDWKWLCRSCHVKSDNRINILRKANEKRHNDYINKLKESADNSTNRK